MNPRLRRGLSCAGLLLAFGLAVPPSSAHPPDDALGASVDQFPVEQDIAALRDYGQEAKQAGRRLAWRGETVVPRLHAALAASAATEKQREQLITLLAEIGQAESVAPILAAARTHRDEPAVVRAALLMLPYLTDEPVAFDLARDLIVDPAAQPKLKRQALAYLGQVRDPRGLELARPLLHADDLDVRAGALWVAVRLGDAAAREGAAALLEGAAPRSLRQGLLLTYAEAATPEELAGRVAETLKETPEYASAMRYCRFRTAAGAERSGVAAEMMRSPYQFEKEVAAAHLLATDGADRLARDFGGSEASAGAREVVRHALRRAGYRVAVEDGKMRIRGHR